MVRILSSHRVVTVLNIKRGDKVKFWLWFLYIIGVILLGVAVGLNYS